VRLVAFADMKCFLNYVCSPLNTAVPARSFRATIGRSKSIHAFQIWLSDDLARPQPTWMTKSPQLSKSMVRLPLSHLSFAQFGQRPLVPFDGALVNVCPLPLAHGTESKQAALKLLLNAERLRSVVRLERCLKNSSSF
jgi:hypothetical protein